MPDWIRHARVDGYATAHELLPDETALFGTETLFGDWSGQVLLLAKDFAPSQFLRQRIAEGDPQPYRHEPRMRANRVLQVLARPLEARGLLYGSALANLLRDDGRVSGPLPNRTEAIAYGADVLRFVIENMPRLQRIICMGRDAWECGCQATGMAGSWEAFSCSGDFLGPLVATYHPSARVSREQMRLPWDCLVLDSPR